MTELERIEQQILAELIKLRRQSYWAVFWLGLLCLLMFANLAK